MQSKFNNPAVAEKFNQYPKEFRVLLYKLRELIFAVAKENPVIGEIEESLKWGEPSYRAQDKKIGTSIRLAWNKNKPNQCGMYVHCQTNLIEQYKILFDDMFEYEDKRALIFSKTNVINNRVPIKECIYLALTYHLNKKSK
ncbi:MAG TPA: DUF1801 domain-containing protein [Oligoflexia bacterium]|nr:DUF1801 domain-containing protein [Oligoflexia bacterium]HMR24927.1 DUF1801 domain-containing protein [Oligoflexia bacterium]